MGPSPSRPAISSYVNTMWHHTVIPMAKRTLFLRKLLIPQRRRTALVVTGRGLIRLFGHPKSSLKNIKTVPSATHTYQFKVSCYGVPRVESSGLSGVKGESAAIQMLQESGHLASRGLDIDVQEFSSL